MHKPARGGHISSQTANLLSFLEADSYNFDVAFSNLSIYDVFRAFGARQILFPAPTKCSTGTKTLCFEGLQ